MKTFKEYAITITQILGLIALIFAARKLYQSETQLEAIKLSASSIVVVLYLIYISASKK